MGNYSFNTTNLPEPVGGIVEGHNFTQGVPHTAIYAGQTGLTFKDCNLTNCDVPLDSTFISCGPRQISFCSHVHPSWLDRGAISECSVSCVHLDHVDNITIDGVVVDSNYVYADKAVA